MRTDCGIRGVGVGRAGESNGGENWDNCNRTTIKQKRKGDRSCREFEGKESDILWPERHGPEGEFILIFNKGGKLNPRKEDWRGRH